MKSTQQMCKKCSKQLLSDEKKYCRHCADERKNNRNGVLASVGAVMVLAISVVSLGKINLKK